MKSHATAGKKSRHDVFTEKQRRVLDLLIQNKTSKEIGRALGISPYTVDQRISIARGKLGLSSRNELATCYRQMQEEPGSLPDVTGSDTDQSGQTEDGSEHTPTPNDGTEHPADQQEEQDDADPVLGSSSAEERISCPTDETLDYRVGPEVFEGRFSGLWRTAAVVATALLLVMTVLGLLAIFVQLNELLA